MLQPKRMKYRKPQKGRIKGLASRGAKLSFGSFGIKSLEEGFITARQINAKTSNWNELASFAIPIGSRKTKIIIIVPIVATIAKNGVPHLLSFWKNLGRR